MRAASGAPEPGAGTAFKVDLADAPLDMLDFKALL